MIRGYDQWKTAYPPEYDDPIIPMDELETALSKLGTNRNTDCWAVPFCGKDADLEPHGCTGIEGLRYPDEDTITVLIGGHKTVCGVNQENVYNMPDGDVEMWMDLATEIVCGCSIGGEWTGDDWCLSFNDAITVKWEYTNADNADIEYDVEKTAEKVFAAAIKVVETDYDPELILLDECMDRLYNEAIEKYGE